MRGSNNYMRMGEIHMKKIIILCIASVFVLNSIMFAESTPTQPTHESYDLLIITPEKFMDALQALVTHKETYNLKTMMVSLPDIYEQSTGRDHAEQIKYFIKDAYDNWGIEYVLLIGGRKPSLLTEQWLLPVRYAYIEDNVAVPENRYISDLYFADLYDKSGNFSSWDTNNNGIFCEWYGHQSADDICDLYPEVYVGRLPCRNTIEVNIMVNKIITYEQQTYGSDWFQKMVVIGGDTYTNNDYFEGEVANQQALDWMTDFQAVKLWTSEGTFRHWTDVVKTLNKGCGFVFFAGHGSPASWGTHPPYDNTTWVFGLNREHMPFLVNKNQLPICVVGGCHNSMFNISLFQQTWTFGIPVLECWSWHLTRKIGGGSIATLGCTGLGYGKEDKQDPSQGGGGDWLNVLFFKAYNQNTNNLLGKVWGDALTLYIDEFPIDWNQHAFNDTALDAKTVQEWVLLGDPSLKIGGYP